jgi:hypothetical protein
MSYLRSSLIVSSYVSLGLPSDLFPSDFLTKILYALLICPMHTTCLIWSCHNNKCTPASVNSLLFNLVLWTQVTGVKTELQAFLMSASDRSESSASCSKYLTAHRRSFHKSTDRTLNLSARRAVGKIPNASHQNQILIVQSKVWTIMAP